MAIALYSEKETTIQEIDHIALKYGLLRLENESIEAFKERILSLFIYPGSLSSAGLAAYLSRKFGVAPKIVGYLHIPGNMFVHYSNSVLKASPFDDGSSQEIITSKNIDLPLEKLSTAFADVNELESENPVSVIILEEAYSSKNCVFIMPFENYKIRATQKIRPGISSLEDSGIISNTIKSNSDYVVTQVQSASLITKIGEYYFDGESKIITFDDGTNFEFEISYSKKWDFVPLVYCPIAAMGLAATIPSDFENYEFADLNIARSPYGGLDTISKDKLNLLWAALVKNARIWKAKSDSPVSVKGTYHAI